MYQLTQNFTLEEFAGRDEIPPACIPAFLTLCQQILEPTREWSDSALFITSGYRGPTANAAAHGQPNSEHMATSDWCACDFFPKAVDTRIVFDWMKSNPTLPFHQLILEQGVHGYVIHVSWNRLKPGVRSVLMGATHNSEPYLPVDHVPYSPPQDV